MPDQTRLYQEIPIPETLDPGRYVFVVGVPPKPASLLSGADDLDTARVLAFHVDRPTHRSEIRRRLKLRQSEEGAA